MLKNLLAAAALTTASAGAASAGSVADLRWDKRIVILFSTGTDNRIDAEKRRLLADERALAERDMLVFAVVGDKVQPVYGSVPTGDSADALRKRFDVPADTAFSTILIGKDGGVKWRGERPIDEAELFGIVDAMPMRRAGK